MDIIHIVSPTRTNSGPESPGAGVLYLCIRTHVAGEQVFFVKYCGWNV